MRSSIRAGLAMLVLAGPLTFQACSATGAALQQSPNPLARLVGTAMFVGGSHDDRMKEAREGRSEVNVHYQGSNEGNAKRNEPTYLPYIWEVVDLNNDEIPQFEEIISPELNSPAPQVPWMVHVSLGDIPGDYYLKDSKGRTIDMDLGLAGGKGAKFGRVPAGEYIIYAKDLSSNQIHSRNIRFTGDYSDRDVRVWKYVDRNGNGKKDEGEMDSREIFSCRAEIPWIGFFMIPSAANYRLYSSSGEEVSKVLGIEKGKGAFMGVNKVGIYTIIAEEIETGEKHSREVRFTGTASIGGPRN